MIADIAIPDEVKANPDAYVKIGEEYHDELEAKPATMFWLRQVREKYRFKDDRTKPPVSVPAPLPTIPGTLCGPALMAQILTDKYCDHLPHYRQSRRFLRRYAIELSRQTINEWTHSAIDLLGPIGDAIRESIIRSGAVQIDETPIPYLQPGTGSTGTGYLWPMLDALSGEVYFGWYLGRGHDCLVDMLGLGDDDRVSFEGTIQCDGFSAYETLARRYPNIELGGCLAHIRRPFFEAQDQNPEVVMPILLLIQKLYRIERQLRQSGAPPGCRELVRRTRARPIVDELLEKIEFEKKNGGHFPQSAVGKALSYALNQWAAFSRYLIDGRLEIDNNLVENAIRPTKLGAKNYLFFGSAAAGANSALIYTLLASCANHGLDSETYLKEVFRRLGGRRPEPEEAARLTPRAMANDLEFQTDLALPLLARRLF